jgi:hypothetical protein
MIFFVTTIAAQSHFAASTPERTLCRSIPPMRVPNLDCVRNRIRILGPTIWAINFNYLTSKIGSALVTKITAFRVLSTTNLTFHFMAFPHFENRKTQ